MKTRKILRTVLYSVLAAVGLINALLALLNLAIRPENVRNLVERYSKEYINAEIKADTIEIHLLRDFPYASLSVKNCSIRSLAFEKLDSVSRALVPSEADSLAEIGSLNISASLTDLLLSRINIKGIELESARINGYMSQFGVNNWDIMKETADTTADSDTTSFALNISRIAIGDGARISLCNAKDSLRTDFTLREMQLKGLLSSDISDNYISRARISGLVLSSGRMNRVIADSVMDNSMKFSVDSLDISRKRNSSKAEVDIRTRTDMRFHGMTVARNIPIDLKGGLQLTDLDDGGLGIELDDFTVYAATLPVTVNGSMILSDSGMAFDSLKGRIDSYNISDLFEYIPEKFLRPGIVETDAAISMRTLICGNYSFETDELPTVDMTLTVPSSSLSFEGGEEGRKAAFSNIETALSMHFDNSNPRGNTIDISKLKVEGRGVSLDASARIGEYTADPLIDLKLGCGLNLDTLSAVIPVETRMTARGSVEGDFLFKGRMSDLELSSVSRNEIIAKLATDSLRLEMPEQGLRFNCGGLSLLAGTVKNETDTVMPKEGRIFNLGFSLDTLLLDYRDSLHVSGSKAFLEANQEPPKQPFRPGRDVIRINGRLGFNSISVTGADSSRIRLRGSESRFTVIPSEDGKRPVAELKSDLRSVSAVSSGSRFFARNCAAALRIVPSPPDMKAPEDSADNGKRFMRAVLKDWEVSGSLQSSDGRVITPSFPLRTRFSNLNLAVSNDGLSFDGAGLNVGRSSVTVSGRMEGFAEAVTEHKTLKFTGSVSSDTLDVNQLLRAFSSSEEADMTDSRSDETVEAAMSRAEEADTSSLKAPVLPGYLDADINLDLRNVIFKDDMFKSISGNLIARNSIFQMNGFKVVTRSGEIDLGAFYAAKKADDISLGFDMRMNRFEVSEIIGFIPEIDTLFPMFRSFSGKITCTLSMMTKVDSLFNIRLETMNGLGIFEGENLVLLDGETFTEIAKMLKFKNKEKNYIDRISAQFVAADNKIELFPFVVQMDRYKAAVSGTQNMDMSFKYHISVLKCPLPFRIGLNITGTADDMRFKIGRCLYKDEKVPVFTAEIDSARVNLGKSIRNVFRNGVEKTMSGSGSGALAKAAEAQTVRSDSMESLSQSELKQLDETSR